MEVCLAVVALTCPMVRQQIEVGVELALAGFKAERRIPNVVLEHAAGPNGVVGRWAA